MQRSKGQPPKARSFGRLSMEQGLPNSNDLPCFNCEIIFPSRSLMEEHCCPSAAHICSCGTEFPLYSDMAAHKKTHPPGHSVLDHQAIWRRRAGVEQKETTRPSAQPGASSLPGVGASPASSLEVVSKYQFPSQPPPPNSGKISKLFYGPAAPTVDLWTIYQPVVLLMERSTSQSKGTYSCGKCLQGFSTKSDLTLHYHSHARDKVFGCLGCGMLLSSGKALPQYHQCSSPARSVPPGVIATRPVAVKPSAVPVTRTTTPPSSKSKPPAAAATRRRIRLDPFTRPYSLLGWRPGKVEAFPCGVCHVMFDSVKVLQRHKCDEAKKIVLDKKAPRPQSSAPARAIDALKSPYRGAQAARGKALGVGPLGVADVCPRGAVGLSNGTGGLPVGQSVDLDSDDDCYIIESSTTKPNTLFSSLSLLKK